jgi:hypothetical protein
MTQIRSEFKLPAANPARFSQFLQFSQFAIAPAAAPYESPPNRDDAGLAATPGK